MDKVSQVKILGNSQFFELTSKEVRQERKLIRNFKIWKASYFRRTFHKYTLHKNRNFKLYGFLSKNTKERIQNIIRRFSQNSFKKISLEINAFTNTQDTILKMVQKDNGTQKIESFSINDFKSEINQIKLEIANLKEKQIKEIENYLNKAICQKWYIKINLIINQEFKISAKALFDTGAGLYCIKEGIIPTKYFEKTKGLRSANGSNLKIQHKLSNVCIENQNVFCKTSFLSKDLTTNIILGTPFINLLKPFTATDEGIITKTLNQNINCKFISKPKEKIMNFLNKEVNNLNSNK